MPPGLDPARWSIGWGWPGDRRRGRGATSRTRSGSRSGCAGEVVGVMVSAPTDGALATEGCRRQRYGPWLDLARISGPLHFYTQFSLDCGWTSIKCRVFLGAKLGNSNLQHNRAVMIEHRCHRMSFRIAIVQTLVECPCVATVLKFILYTLIKAIMIKNKGIVIAMEPLSPLASTRENCMQARSCIYSECL
jgi:hypothetical protein